MDVTLAPNTNFELATPRGHFVVAYVFEGEAAFGADDAGNGEMLMACAPFKEPIFPYSPFVMNTREEIIQTLAE